MTRAFTSLLALFLVQSVSAQTTTTPTAGIKFGAITGASNVSVTGSTAKIYGGLAGTCANGQNATCNSCTGLVACNEVRIQNSLRLNIPVDTKGTATLKLIKSDSTTEIPNAGASADSLLVSWNDLCDLVTTPNSINCDIANGHLTTPLTTQVSVDLRVWQDNNTNGTVDNDEALTLNVNFVPSPASSDTTDGAEGVSSFTTFPGDEKIYLDLADIPSSTGNGSTLYAIRALFSDVNFDQAKPGTEFGVQDLVVNGDEIEKLVDGLTNGTHYHVRLAVVDQAKNVFYWTSNNYLIDPTTGGSGACLTAAAAAPSDWPACQHVGVPDPVFGMLTKDLNCFVATAAYGSSLEPKLNVFRQFRYLLLHHSWGKSFVSWYYRVGPKGALLIYDKPVVRFFVRGLLWPAYGFALLTIRFGFALAFAMTALFVLSVIALFVPFSRKLHRAKI